MIRTLLQGAVVSLLVSGGGAFAWAQSAAGPARPPELESVIRAEMDRLHLPGLAVAIVQDGSTQWLRCFGWADLEQGVPVTTLTHFRFASVSKSITAVAALRLVGRGRLKLDQPVRTCLGDEAGAMGADTTLRHLLGHQSGLRHYPGRVGEASLRRFSNLAEALKDKAADAPLAAPGKRFTYSSHGYLALGRLLERVEDTAFSALVSREVFEPAGMKGARVEDLYALIPHRAPGYFWSLQGQWRRSATTDLTDRSPGGGLGGNVMDLAAFVAALQNGALLSPAQLREMWTPQGLADGTPTPYGLGWYLDRSEGTLEAYHPGTQAQVSTLVYLQPERRIGLVFLGNLEQVSFLPLARQVARLSVSSSRLP